MGEGWLNRCVARHSQTTSPILLRPLHHTILHHTILLRPLHHTILHHTILLCPLHHTILLCPLHQTILLCPLHHTILLCPLADPPHSPCRNVMLTSTVTEFCIEDCPYYPALPVGDTKELSAKELSAKQLSAKELGSGGWATYLSCNARNGNAGVQSLMPQCECQIISDRLQAHNRNASGGQVSVCVSTSSRCPIIGRNVLVYTTTDYYSCPPL
jgi:hypothetical protein